MSAPTAFSHIACCIDDSEAGMVALAHAERLRDLSRGRLSIVHAIAPPPFLVSMAAQLGGAPVHDDDAERKAAQAWLDGIAAGMDGAEPVLLEGHPGETVCAWARDMGVDTMVAASHGGRIERALLGSFAAFITQHAPCPVLLIPPGLNPSA